MLTYAYYENKEWKRKISIDEYNNKMKGKILCSEGHELIAKKGKIKVHHFCHKKSSECFCCRDMSEWHMMWQRYINPENLEIVMIKTLDKNDIIKEKPTIKSDTINNQNNTVKKKHIADCILSNGKVVEFQKSPINETIIKERESFYINMFWIFDISKCNFICNHGIENNKVEIIFTSGNLFFLNAKPEFYLDTGKNSIIKVNEIKSNKKVCGEIIKFKDFVKMNFLDILIEGENLTTSREDAPEI